MTKGGRPRKTEDVTTSCERDRAENNREKAAGLVLPEGFRKFEDIPKNQKFSSSIVFEKETHLAFKKWCLDNETNFSETIYLWIVNNCRDYLP